VSAVLADEVLQRGANGESVHVLPNAIDPSRFRSSELAPSLRAKLGLDDAIVIGHVGLFYRWDRLDVLIELAKSIREWHPNVKVLLVGDGPEMVNLKETSHQFGMEDSVIFPGPVHRDDVPAYIGAMDICVLPDSNAFGSPIALFEFMAMGKPCVVPDLGPMRDVIEDNVTGIVFPHGDYAALGSALQGLVEDPVLRSQLGARARETVFARHTWSVNANLVVQLAAGGSPSRSLAQMEQIDCDTH
jgi:glycosyltransferase involved in cell wall biosynthesis